MFKKYNSLTNHTDKKFLQKIMYEGLTDSSIQWIAREKIHGANFSFLVSSDNIVTVAKRSGPIEVGESFFDHYDILKRYKEQALQVKETLIDGNKASVDSVIQIFGEYAGTLKSGKKIQQEVDYGPSDFYVFDILVDGIYLNERDIGLATFYSEFRTAPIIAIGSFDTLINIRNDFDSIVTDIAGVLRDGLKYTNTNTAEGFVMRPYKEVHFIGESRVMIKHKNEKFSERKQRVKNFVPPVQMTEIDQEVLTDLLTYNTENRLKNVLSKIGVPNTKQFGMVMGLTVKDILEESGDLLEHSENPSVVKKQLINEVQNLIRPHWLNICQGEF